MVQLKGKTIGRFLRDAEIDQPCDPTIPLLVTYPSITNSAKERIICTPVFIATHFTIAKV